MREECKNTGNKRSRNKSEWAREKQKQARVAGLPYVNKRGELVQGRRIGADCGCRRKCFAKVPHSVREEIFRDYYNLGSHDGQNAHLFKLIRRETPYRRRAKDPARARGNSYQYYVRVDGFDVQVCREAFAHIHGISVHKVRVLCQKMEQNVSYPLDKRGKHDNRKKTPREIVDLIRNHIRSVIDSNSLADFLKEESSKLKGAAAVNISQMWKHFLATHDPKYRDYVITKKSQIYLKDDPKETPVEPLAKHWIYSKVFHDEFEREVAMVVGEDDLKLDEYPCEETLKSPEMPEISKDVLLSSVNVFVEDTSDDLFGSAVSDDGNVPSGDPDVFSEFKTDSQDLPSLVSPATGLDLDQNSLLMNGLRSPSVTPTPSMIMPGVQWLGPLNVLLDNNTGGFTLPSAAGHEPSQQQLVVLPVTFSSMTVPGAVITGMVVDGTAIFNSTATITALRPSFIG